MPYAWVFLVVQDWSSHVAEGLRGDTPILSACNPRAEPGASTLALKP
jgi:hypothetical protein